MDADVIIAGAGPAGVATALALVRDAGVPPLRILCLDRARFPRPKPCGGGLTGHALTAMAALGLRLRVSAQACSTSKLVFRHVAQTVELPRPVWVVRRDEFDADLVEQGRAAGTVICEGEGLASFRVGDAVEVTTTAGRCLRARILVGADGAGGPVRRSLNPPDVGKGSRHRPLRLARLELPAPTMPGRSADLSSSTTMVYDFSPFDHGLRGYVWLFPVPGNLVNVGIMHQPASRSALPARRFAGSRRATPDAGGDHPGSGALDVALRRALLRYGITLSRPARGWPAWSYSPDTRVSAPHVLCVGDAAGIDGLTGEGIAVAFDQARVAAAAIARALASRDFSFASYGAALRQATVGRELAVDRCLAALLYGAEDPRPLLALVMGDRRLQRLLAARVSGSEILADRKWALAGALARHVLLGRQRMAALFGA